MSSSSILKIEVVFHLKKIKVIFHLKIIEVIFHISSSWVKTMLHTKNQLPTLPRPKLRSSSIWRGKKRSSFIFKNIEVVFHNSSSWVKIRLHTENQLPGLPGSALTVCVGWWWWWWVGSTQLCGHPNFVLCWSWVVTICNMSTWD
jgi:hypothetical protein